MKKSKLFPQMQFLIEKVKKLYLSGRHASLTLLIDGKRVTGKELKNVEFGKLDLSFEFEGKEFSIPFSKFLDVKRLRTRKYLFLIQGENKNVELPKDEEPSNAETLPSGLAEDITVQEGDTFEPVSNEEVQEEINKLTSEEGSIPSEEVETEKKEDSKGE